MPRTTPPVSILIPAFNQLDYCKACIESLVQATDRPYRLILVDNASTDGVAEYFDSIPEAIVLHAPKNLGFAGGVNLGLTQAAGHVVLLNSDTLLSPGWLDRLLAPLEEDERIGLIGPVSNQVAGPQQIETPALSSQAAINAFSRDRAEAKAGLCTEVTRLVGFCLLIRDTVLEAVGAFDERFGIGNYEDDDYCTRVRHAGYRLLIAESSFVYHHGGRTFTGMGLEGESFRQLMQENREKYKEKWQVYMGDAADSLASANRFIIRAKQALATGNSSGAILYLKSAIEADPENPMHYCNLAALLMEARRYEPAYQLALQALKLDATDAHALEQAQQLAQQLHKTEDLNAFLKTLEEERMIYFLCPDFAPPSGGVRKMYRQVDILQEAGLPAAILHHKPPFRCAWFEHETPIAYLREITWKADDVAVIPEIFGLRIAAMFPGVPKVVLNQNAYNTFSLFSLDREASYGCEDLLGIITVSEDNLELLRFAFPKTAIKRIRYAIDTHLFYYSETKTNQICFMPRKNENDLRNVLHFLRLRGCDWPYLPIEEMDEEEAAAAMRASRIFLSFGHPEGFGLPPAEAMACGCTVIGYHGMGGKEFFRPPYAHPIPFGDIRLFVETVERLVKRPHSEKEQEAAAFIREHYSQEREKESVLLCWEAFLKQRDAGSV